MSHVVFEGTLRREIEWGRGGSGNGEIWAKCNVDVTPERGSNDTDGFVVTLSGQLALDAAKSLRPGDRLLVSGQLIVGAFHTQDGAPGRVLEIRADSVGVVPGLGP